MITLLKITYFRIYFTFCHLDIMRIYTQMQCHRNTQNMLKSHYMMKNTYNKINIDENNRHRTTLIIISY